MMKNQKHFFVHLATWIITAVVFLFFSAGVVVLLLWLAGKFTPKVPSAEPPQSPAPAIAEQSTEAHWITLPVFETAVGTIRSVHETTISSKILARVVEVDLKAGQSVRAGDVLVRLDDTDLRARFQQAKAAVTSAEALYSQAVRDERRDAPLHNSKVISDQEYQKTLTARNSYAAELRRAQESVNEMQAMLDSATVRATSDGIITDKKVDVGDMVTPGQVLATLFDPKRMQLVASVRESLTDKLQVGQNIGVQVDVLKKLCSGTISEIVPEAQSASRTFQVKVTGPCPAGIYTGMFGRIQIPLQEEQVLVIPRRAVRNVGQLELVDVVENGAVSRRAVRTGRRALGESKNEVEVLSGLREGERVLLHAEPEAEDNLKTCPT
jgi:RND family efflux transporter MFP subunit